MLSAVNNNTPNFKAGYHIYFYTNDGKRIVSDANMKKCLHYMEAHLNGSKRVKEPNLDLIRNFALGQKKADGIRTGGDKDYFDCQRIRSVIDKTKDKIQGFINIVTGKDALAVDDMYGKAIGLSKGEGLKRAGTTRTFESGDAISRYIDKAPNQKPYTKTAKDRLSELHLLLFITLKGNTLAKSKASNTIIADSSTRVR